MKRISFALFPLIAATIFLQDDCSRPRVFNLSIANQSDGPYVLYRGDKMYVNYIADSQGIRTVITDSIAVSNKASLSLTILTDEPGKTFSVQL